MQSLLLGLPDLRLNDLSAPLELLLSKIVDPAWAAALAANAPFTDQITTPLELAFESEEASLRVPGGAALVLGGAAGAKASLHLLWPGQTPPAVAQRLQELGLLHHPSPGAGAHWLLLDLGGEARATVRGGAPLSGLLKATYALSADGRVRLARVLPMPAGLPSLQALQCLFGSLRWPLAAPRPGSAWRPGETWLVETDGDLQISLGLQGGYEFSGSAGLDLGNLPVSWGYQLAAKVELKAGFTLSGRLLIALAHGEDEGWMRCVVRRGSVRGAEFALGIDVVAEASTEDLPEDPQAFLAAALGVETGAATEWLKLIAEHDTPAAFLAAAQGKLGDRLAAWLESATSAVVERVGGQDAFATVRASLTRFRQGLDTLPAGAAALVAEKLERLPELTSQIDGLLGKLSAERARGWLDENELGILWSLGLERAHEAFDEKVRKELKPRLEGLRELITQRVDDQVADWLAELRARADVKTALEHLATLESHADLEELVASGLGELAELLLEEKLPALAAGPAPSALYARLRSRVAQVQSLLTRLGELLARARAPKLELSVAAAFAARREKTALIDVEINLAHSRGPELLEALCRGDCRELTRLAGRPGAPVRLRACALEEARTRRSTVTISAFGGRWISASELTERLHRDHVETEDGVVCLYTAETRRQTTDSGETRRGYELAQNALLLRRLAQAKGDEAPVFTDYQAELEVLRTRRPATPEAVAAVLEFARTLGLIEDVAEYAARLASEFGEPPGEISATYRVAYRPQALRRALDPKTGLAPRAIAEVAIAAVRDYVRVRHGGRFSVNIEAHLAQDLFAGAAPTLPDEAEADRIRGRLKRALIRHAPRRPGERGQRGALGTNAQRFEWHEAELKCLGLLRRLREELARPAPDLPALEKLSRALLCIRAPFLDLQRGNVLFLIFDRLILAHDPSARAGLASLELKLKPSDSEQSARRLLVA